MARQHFQQPNISFGLSIPSFVGPPEFPLENVTIDRFFDDNRCLHVDSYAVYNTLGSTIPQSRTLAFAEFRIPIQMHRYDVLKHRKTPQKK